MLFDPDTMEPLVNNVAMAKVWELFRRLMQVTLTISTDDPAYNYQLPEWDRGQCLM